MSDEATRHTTSKAASPPSLAGAPWLAWPSTRAVLRALAARGHAARIVGGAVRNTLMGLPVADLDIATPAVPEAVIAAAEAAGLHCVPTGIVHGTVTVIADHRPIEVTTLRRDVATDGRRATVAFTEDWAEDAQRRDFTINALYCDAAGTVFDPVGGYPDLVSRHVRFIGDADRRIAEDYLRILRFFRFHAAFGEGAPDPVAMAASARGLAGMSRLSAERVRAEMVRLLVAPRAVEAVEAMGDIGLAALILGAAPRPGVLARVAAAEAALGVAPDAMLRLSALAVACDDDIPRLAERLRLSNDERQALITIDGALSDRLAGLDEPGARRLVYGRGAPASRQSAAALAAMRPEASESARMLVRLADTWTPPRMPVAGGDLVRAGLAPGPRIGQLLAALEAWWVAHDFADEASVRRQLAAMVAAEGESGGGGAGTT
jgi:tRNA nucleotidyltransferase/poly(A) polymerase